MVDVGIGAIVACAAVAVIGAIVACTAVAVIGVVVVMLVGVGDTVAVAVAVTAVSVLGLEAGVLAVTIGSETASGVIGAGGSGLTTARTRSRTGAMNKAALANSAASIKAKSKRRKHTSITR
jgi:hypothetical protein